MNRALVFGIAMFFAIVGLSLVGGSSQAVAGLGDRGCNGGSCGGIRGKVDRCDGRDRGAGRDRCHGRDRDRDRCSGRDRGRDRDRCSGRGRGGCDGGKCDGGKAPVQKDAVPAAPAKDPAQK